MNEEPTQTRPMSKDLLFQLFDCAFGTSSGPPTHWRPPPPPTASDIENIEDQLQVDLPSLLVELAITSPYFAKWFAELGPNRASERHIISTNEWLKQEGKPSNLVVLTHAYDGDCVGILRESGQEPEETPIVIVSINLWGDRNPSDPRAIAPNFYAYLKDVCLDMAPRSRIKSLRRRAKKLIAEWQESDS